MRVFPAAVLCAALVLLAVPVAADEEIEPTFRTERAYFHCQDDVKVQNVTTALATPDPWDTTPPAQSVQDGAGCGFVEYGVAGAGFDMEFNGTFAGNVRDLTVHLHEISHSDQQPFGTEVLVTLIVDGQTRLDHEGAQMLPVTSENSGVTNAASFTITGLDYATENGDGSTVRTFELIIGSPLRGSSTWVWDTTEVPAGITFNPGSPSGPEFAAT